MCLPPLPNLYNGKEWNQGDHAASSLHGNTPIQEARLAEI